MSEGRDHDLNALAAHLEGRLGTDERRKTLEHLSRCLECRETAASLARSWPAVRSGDRPRFAWVVAVSRAPWFGLAAVVVVATVVAIRVLPTRHRVAEPTTSESSPAPDARALAPERHGPPPPTASEDRPQPTGREAGGAIDESLLARRGGARRVAGKTFRYLGGEWVDSSFDPAADLPVVEITGPGERDRILARLPDLTPFAALGDRVVVVYDGTAYRFRPGR